MIAAAVQNTSWWMGGGFGFNWFDVTLVAVLAFGFWRGRRNGMSREILPVAKWLVLVTACTLGYTWLAARLIQWGVIKSLFGTFFRQQTAACLTAYLAIALVVFLIFAFVKKAFFKEKTDGTTSLEGSNAFGSGEYYLGMVSGVVRYACILVFLLALLNAPVYSMADLQNLKTYRNQTFGGGLAGYNGDFIPTLDEVQAGVFKNSLLGPQIKNNLGVLLINTDGSSNYHTTAQKQPVIHFGN
jgi:hypothetical protein